MYCMFNNCAKLEFLNIKNFITYDKYTFAYNVFWNSK